ncbi:hypothetical protein ACA910_005462 [Epithemia clementina (nom. ined.)]
MNNEANAAAEKPLVFLCHTGADWRSNKPFVREVNRQLRDIGIKTFFDEQNIEYGDSIPERIDKAISHTKIAVIFFSKAFFRRKWPMQEFKEFCKRRERNETVILPVVINLTHKYYTSRVNAEIAQLRYYSAHRGCVSEIVSFLQSYYVAYCQTSPLMQAALPPSTTLNPLFMFDRLCMLPLEQPTGMDLGCTLEQFPNDAKQELLGEWNNSRGNPNYPLMSSLVTSIEGRSEKKQLAWDAAMQWKNVVTENEQRFVLWLDGNALVRSYLNAAERINHYVPESRRRQHDGQQAMV